MPRISETRESLSSTYVPRVQEVADAIGEWWIYPTAQYVASPPRTYFGAISATGAVLACVFDHGALRTKRYEVGQAPVDDHCVPSVSVASGHRTIVAWTDHNANSFIRYRVTGPSGDLSTLGPALTLNIGGLASYTQIHRNPADLDQFWLFSRAWPTASPYEWVVVEGNIAPATGVITWGTVQSLMEFDSGDQGYMTTAPVTIGADPGVRFAVTGNPTNGDLHEVYYGTINFVSGAIESPGKAITANIDGTGLPLTVATDLDQAWAPAEGYTTRLFAVRGGDDDPAVALATWDTASSVTPSTYYHLTRATSADPGLHVDATTAYASTPDSAAFDVPSLKLRWYGTPAGYGVSQNLAHKYAGADGDRSFQFRLLTTDQLRFQWHPTGTVTAVTVDSGASVNTAEAVGFAVEFTPDTGSGYLVQFFETTDGENWTQVGSNKTGAASTFLPGGAPFYVGYTSANVTGTVRKMEVFAAVGSATIVAGPDFTDPNEWIDGDTDTSAREDAYGLTWTLAGDCTIEGDGWTQQSLGEAGDAFGQQSTSRYLSGMAYPVPSRGELVYVGREDAGTWTIEKRSRSTGTWDTEVLATSDDSMLARPLAVTGGGPFDVVYSDLSAYAGFNSYAGDAVGV